MNYEQTIELLTSQAKFRIELGLERVKSILNILDNPQDKIKIIHIAGTNGKGSVSSTVGNILNKAGYKTGLYTSPHLINYTERIKINNNNISESQFANYIEEICNIANNNNIDLTEFEILTVCAFKYFYDEKTDIAIIETGLGGRYDATNTTAKTLLSVITSISLDHTDRLGKTIEEIAFEKAGIIKKNSNVIISKRNKGLKTIIKYAKEQECRVIATREDIKTFFKNGKNHIIYKEKAYEFNLLGTYQNQNAEIILKIIEFLNENNFTISDKALIQGLKTVTWPARFEYIKEKGLILDGAHNPDAAIELKKSLDFYFPNKKRIFIYSTLDTKDYISIAENLFTQYDTIYYYEFNHKNAVPFETYKSKIDWLKINKIDFSQINQIINNKNLKIICGSLYMLGQLYNNKNKLLQ